MRLGPGSANPSPQSWPLVVAILILVTACISFHITAALKGYADYRDQHLGTALVYAKGQVNLLRPIVIGFNANNTATPLEFPIWQALAAILFKAFGGCYVWANVASLLLGLATLWPVYQLARSYSGQRAAWWTLLFFVSQPLVFYYNGCASTDGSSLSFAMWFLYFANLLVRTGEVRWLLPSMVTGSLSAVTKAPFFFCVGLASFFLLQLNGPRDLKRWTLLLLTGAVAAGVFALWTAHSNAELAQAEFPLVDLRLNAGSDGGKFMRDWYFGDWQYRLTVAHWIRGGWRFLTAVLGSFALLGLMLWGAISSRFHIGQMLFVAGAFTTLVFTHLVLHHTHYYLMFAPAAAMLCGVAAEKLESILKVQASGLKWSLGFVGSFTLILFLSTVQGLAGMKVALIADPYPERIAQVLRQYTSASDKLLIQGGGWGGDILMRSGRRGLSIWDTDFLEQPRNLERIRKLGLSKLVMVSQSPLLLALQQSNPGQANQQRDTYTNHLSPVTGSWPMVFQTDDVLIKEIPPLASHR